MLFYIKTERVRSALVEYHRSNPLHLCDANSLETTKPTTNQFRLPEKLLIGFNHPLNELLLMKNIKKPPLQGGTTRQSFRSIGEIATSFAHRF